MELRDVLLSLVTSTNNSIDVDTVCSRFNLPESTIRMWLRKSDGLDYRGPSYSKPPAEKVRFQGSLQVQSAFCQVSSSTFCNQDYLVDAPDDINIEAGSSKYTNKSKPKSCQLL